MPDLSRGWRLAPSERSQKTARAARVAVLCGLVFFTGALLPLVVPALGGQAGYNEDAGSLSLVTLIYLAFHVISGIIALLYLRHLVWILRTSMPLLLMLSWVFLSLSWSPDPMLSGQRAVALLGSTLLGLAVVFTMDEDEFYFAFVCIFGALAVLSLIVVFLVPSIGIHQAGDAFTAHHAGKWRGVFGHKNTLGRLSAPLIPLLLLFRPPRLPQYARWLFIGTAILLVLGSHSKQGVAIVWLMLIFGVFVRLGERLDALQLALALAVLASIGAISLFFIEPILLAMLDWLGSDPQLTGRTVAWNVSLGDTLANRPLIGGGFAVGWSGYVHEIASREFGVTAGHAHNGYVTVFQDLGLIGVGLYVIFQIQVFNGLLRARQRIGRETYGFLAMFCFFFVVINFVASELLKHNQIVWTLFVAFAAYVTRGHLTAAQAARYVEDSLLRPAKASVR